MGATRPFHTCVSRLKGEFILKNITFLEQSPILTSTFTELSRNTFQNWYFRGSLDLDSSFLRENAFRLYSLQRIDISKNKCPIHPQYKLERNA